MNEPFALGNLHASSQAPARSLAGASRAAKAVVKPRARCHCAVAKASAKVLRDTESGLARAMWTSHLRSVDVFLGVCLSK